MFLFVTRHHLSSYRLFVQALPQAFGSVDGSSILCSLPFNLSGSWSSLYCVSRLRFIHLPLLDYQPLY